MPDIFTNSGNKLTRLRKDLDVTNSGFQRSYNWTFQSLKLLILRNDLKIVSVTHPFVNFESTGDYKGYISSYTKPSNISISFLEADKHWVNLALEFWDNLKYNPSKGTMYPKAVYEDQAKLTYSGHQRDKTYVTRTYLMAGFYPISRSPIDNTYGSNEITTISVEFNVDRIQPLFVI
jgi:hypothetical protein